MAHFGKLGRLEKELTLYIKVGSCARKMAQQVRVPATQAKGLEITSSEHVLETGSG